MALQAGVQSAKGAVTDFFTANWQLEPGQYRWEGEVSAATSPRKKEGPVTLHYHQQTNTLHAHHTTSLKGLAMKNLVVGGLGGLFGSMYCWGKAVKEAIHAVGCAGYAAYQVYQQEGLNFSSWRKVEHLESLRPAGQHAKAAALNYVASWVLGFTAVGSSFTFGAVWGAVGAKEPMRFMQWFKYFDEQHLSAEPPTLTDKAVKRLSYPMVGFRLLTGEASLSQFIWSVDVLDDANQYAYVVEKGE